MGPVRVRHRLWELISGAKLVLPGGDLHPRFTGSKQTFQGTSEMSNLDQTKGGSAPVERGDMAAKAGLTQPGDLMAEAKRKAPAPVLSREDEILACIAIVILIAAIVFTIGAIFTEG